MVFLAVAAMLAGGCARFHREDPVTVRAGEEQPPDFLAGPMVVLMTNVDGFSAKLVEDTTVAGATPHRLTGELIGREGRLIFQPSRVSKKKPKDATGLFFIWDGNQERGYVLSEELQGYAPIASDLKITNVSVTPDSAGAESIQEHPCHRVLVDLALNNGAIAKFLEWQADDLRQFPLRVRSLNGPAPVTIEFSDVRLELAAPQLFNPPEGFTQYASSVALMNELMMRQSTLKQRPGELERDMPTTGINGWGQNTPGGPMVPR